MYSLFIIHISLLSYTKTAVCIVGAPRTLMYASNNIASKIKKTEVDVDYFVVLRQTVQSEFNSKESISERTKTHWSDLVYALKAFSPTVFFKNSTTEFVNNPNCKLPASAMKSRDQTNQSSYQRTWETMIGLKECFTGVTKHEVKTNRSYTSVVRLRTDTVFYGNINPILLNPPNAIFPYGRMKCTGTDNKNFCVNDHLAFLPRSTAARYFNMADRYTNCNTNDRETFNYWKQYTSTSWHLARTIVIEMNSLPKVKWYRANVPYTILRLHNMSAMSCKRAGIKYEYTKINSWNAIECSKCVSYLQREIDYAKSEQFSNKICSSSKDLI